MTFHCPWSPKLPSKRRRRSLGSPLRAASAAPATTMPNPRPLASSVCMKQRWEPRSGGQWEGWMQHIQSVLHPTSCSFPGGTNTSQEEPWTLGQHYGTQGCSPASGCLAQKPTLTWPWEWDMSHANGTDPRVDSGSEQHRGEGHLEAV